MIDRKVKKKKISILVMKHVQIHRACQTHDIIKAFGYKLLFIIWLTTAKRRTSSSDQRCSAMVQVVDSNLPVGPARTENSIDLFIGHII